MGSERSPAPTTEPEGRRLFTLGGSHLTKDHKAKVKKMGVGKPTAERAPTLPEGPGGGVVSTERASSSCSVAPLEKSACIFSRASVSSVERRGKAEISNCSDPGSDESTSGARRTTPPLRRRTP
ncbi:hypothetical protein BHE74_00026785 [Ensete ventricosum]|nr:hypothetical protein BHE74_00026785 [Ensete ventricosum]RZR95075.1 hypothetical protein BHM03_00023883 [Ensete ventricosum]